jgi:dipeptidyl aminopeptidase/acylaminoacyl peptidase
VTPAGLTLPHELAGYLDDLAGVRGCWSPSLSPDASRLAFVSDFDGPARAWVTPTSHWDPQPVSAPGDVVALVVWGAGDLLVTSSLPGNTTRTQLSVLRSDGSGQLALGGGAEETVFAGRWSPRGGSYAFSRLGSNEGDVVAVLCDVETGARRVVVRGPGLMVVDVAADEQHVLLRRGPRGRRHLTLARAGVDGAIRLVAGGTTGSSESGRFSPDGKTVYVRTDHDREWTALAAVDVAEWDASGPGTPPRLRFLAERDGAELELLEVFPDGRRLLLVWNTNGVSDIEVFDVETGARRPVIGLPWGVVGGLEISADGSLIAVDHTDPGGPQAIWLVSPDGAVPARKVTDVPVPDPPPGGWALPEHHQFTAHDGVPLSGWLYRPPGSRGPLPTVVSLHGGPEAQERPVFHALLQALVSAGLGVFAPDVRGSAGHGRSFLERDAGLRRRDAIRDVSSAARYLVEAGLAQAEHLGVHGVSYGGYLVLASVADDPDLFAAAVCVCGIADFATFFRTTEPWIASTAYTKYGDPRVDAALLQELSPLHRLHQARTPTRLVHGVLDSNVPISEARQALVVLQQAGVPSDLIALEGEGHQILEPANRRRELESVVGWFREWL